MKCPHCNATLVMTERQGVEIDYCPDCRGVWLDRGELDKILERAAVVQPGPQMGTPIPNPDYEKYPSSQPYYKKKKRESFLDDLFDF